MTNNKTNSFSIKCQMQTAIKRGLRYLSAQQLNGIFPSYFYRNAELSDFIPDPTLFTTATICMVIGDVQGAEAKNLVARSASRMLSHRMPSDIWTYWPLGLQLGTQTILPDVDDTAVISLVLRTITDTPLQCVPALINKRDVYGRFGTWFYPSGFRMTDSVVPYCADDEPDLVVNLNVALFLSTLGYVQNEISRWARDVILNRSWQSCSPFYTPSLPYSLIWAAVRNARAGDPVLTDTLGAVRALVLSLQQEDDTWGDSLKTAIAIDALASLNHSAFSTILPSIQALLVMQKPDGSWPASHFYGSFKRPNVGFGSPALSTAFAIAALHRMISNS